MIIINVKYPFIQFSLNGFGNLYLLGKGFQGEYFEKKAVATMDNYDKKFSSIIGLMMVIFWVSCLHKTTLGIFCPMVFLID
ncbi:MAG: hypothetical protein R2769_03875 [Saprospiraceae bacterium]